MADDDDDVIMSPCPICKSNGMNEECVLCRAFMELVSAMADAALEMSPDELDEFFKEDDE